jgi:hypothetical protein
MSINSYYEFVSMIELGLLNPTPLEEQMYTHMPQCLGESEATCK